MLVAKLAQPRRKWRRGTDPAFALNRFDQDGAGCGPIAAFAASISPKGTVSKPSTLGPKPSRYLGLPAAAIVASVRP